MGGTDTDKLTRRTFQLWTDTDEYQRRIDEARNVVKQALGKFLNPYIAFSGGKDSTVMAHLILQQNPEVTLFHWDYGPYYIPRWLKEEFLSNAETLGARNIRVETSGLYWKEKRGAQNVIGRILIGLLGPKMREEYDACFLGLRAEESSKRKKRMQEFQEDAKGIINVFPVRNLTYRDIWGYIVSHDLPYASVYDRYAPLLGWDQARLVTFFDAEFDHFGSQIVDGVLMPTFRHPNIKKADDLKRPETPERYNSFGIHLSCERGYGVAVSTSHTRTPKTSQNWCRDSSHKK